MKAFGVLLLLISAFLANVSAVIFINGNVMLKLIETDDGILANLTEGNNLKLSGILGVGNTKLSLPSNCKKNSKCFFEDNSGSLKVEEVKNGFLLSWETTDLSAQFEDCFDLNKDTVNWFGGPEKWHDEWPVENVQFDRRPHITLKTDNGAVGERYWLNSLGAFIFIQDRVPLFVDQNHEKDDTICLIASATDPYLNRSRVLLEYVIVAEPDPTKAHLNAVNNFLGKPEGHPDEWIIRNPIWTTWAKYKKDISDEIVLAFAKDIADHGFTGQIEIDDYWETCYGSLTFNDVQFPQINSTVKAVQDLGFTVTLWTHPFVNADCKEPSDYGVENGFFVQSRDGGDKTDWWDGSPARHIDFTKPEGAQWFTERLQLLQQLHGIDSFKFDAGESNYTPDHPIAQGDIELAPNSLTSEYVKTCAKFGGLIEVRSAWRSQNLPIFVRMLDRDSRWGLDNGLHSLITTLLNFNINGYSMVLPDIIGGNAYNEQPTGELLARWTQANAFMPAMQFSYLPWEVTNEDFDGLAIIKKFVKLHNEYADEILEAMNRTIEDGTPVNPPIWWIDPTNKEALKVNDEYLLGENILVAPVIVQGATSRDVVLPKGSWVDGNNGDVIEGPTTLKDYPAPIDVLPFFIKQ